jgi:hypothetical protein
MPFAIMRNAHEAMRASIRLQGESLDAGDLEGFRGEWGNYRKALAVHMAMEDTAMFDLLDEVSGGAITQAGLREEHVEDVRFASAVDAALEIRDLSALGAAWSAWKADHLHHLEHEEQVMMPLVPKTAGTPGAMARVVHDRLLAPCEHLPDFDWYIGWVVRMLSEHGSTEHPPNVATRVFAWALQTDCTADEWNRLRSVVEQNCTPEIWREMTSGFGLDGEGKIVLEGDQEEGAAGSDQ